MAVDETLHFFFLRAKIKYIRTETFKRLTIQKKGINLVKTKPRAPYAYSQQHHHHHHHHFVRKIILV